MMRWFAVLMLAFAGANVASAQNTMTITVTPDKGDHGGPLCVPLSVPAAWAKFDEVAVDVITGRDAVKTVGQLTAPSITTEAIKAAKDGASSSPESASRRGQPASPSAHMVSHSHSPSVVS